MLNDSDISRMFGIPRNTVRNWAKISKTGKGDSRATLIDFLRNQDPEKVKAWVKSKYEWTETCGGCGSAIPFQKKDTAEQVVLCDKCSQTKRKINNDYEQKL